jgi:hypothetical protein
MSFNDLAIVWCRGSYRAQRKRFVGVWGIGKLVEQVKDRPFVVEDREGQEASIKVRKPQRLAGVALY